MKLLRHISPVLVIIIVGVLTRLPQLLNPDIALDGDEAVLGMMVKHTLAGKEFPLYFYGQSYGFSLIEVLFCLPVSLITGVTTFSVKISMLAMWLIGVVYFYKTLLAVNERDKWLPLLLTLLLVAAPAWAVWSMKARGGYLTAFMLTPLVTYLLLDKRFANKKFVYPLIGMLLVVIWEAKPLWVVSIAPILAYVLLMYRTARQGLLLLIFTVITYALFYWYKQGLYQYDPAMVSGLWEIKQNISAIPKNLFYSFTGGHYLGIYYPDNFFTAVFAYCFIAITILLIIYSVYHLLAARQKHFFPVVSASCIILLLIVSLFFPNTTPRFLLPLTTSILLSVQLFVNYNKSMKHMKTAGYALMVVGVIGVVTFWNFRSGYMSKKALKEIVVKLEAHNVKHVLVTYAVLDFQLMFYSDEQIIARNKWYPGRYPEYFKIVDGVYHSHGNIAVVGPRGNYDGMRLNPTYRTPEYYIAINPERGEIAKVFFP